MTRNLAIILLCTALAGCALSPTQRRVGAFCLVLVAGCVLTHQDSRGGHVPTPSVDCQRNPAACH